MALDQNGDPIVAYTYMDPNGDGDPSDSTLSVVSWDAVNGGWGTPRLIDTVGAINTSGTVRSVSLARDTSANTIGVLYTKGVNQLWLALSRDLGNTWTRVLVDSSPYIVAEPSLAMANGRLAFTYSWDGAPLYRAGRQTDAPGAWDREGVPRLLTGSQDFRVESSSLALDSSGNVAVAYWLNNTGAGGGMILAFWRVGFQATQVTDTNGLVTDHPDVRLAFSGNNPRVAFFAARDSKFAAGTDQVWYMASNDGGSTWGDAVAIPNDQTVNMGNRIGLALGGAQTVIVSEVWGVNGQTGNCGEPKLSQATNATQWKTCSPSGGANPVVRALYPAAAFGPDGTLNVVFQNTDGIFLPQGLIAWRAGAVGPSDVAQFSAAGVVNAASFQPGISPGGLFSIFGTNLAVSQAVASATPLPTSLGGARVFANGRLAPLLAAGPGQINAQLPYEIAPGTVSLVVRTATGDSTPVFLLVLPAAPGIFQTASGRAIAQNPDYSLNDAQHPAQPGSVIVVYMNGLGMVDNFVPSGETAPLSPLSQPRQTFKVTIGDQTVVPEFAGLTPGLVGVFQMNLRVPDLSSGDYVLSVATSNGQSNRPFITVGPQ